MPLGYTDAETTPLLPSTSHEPPGRPCADSTVCCTPKNKPLNDPLGDDEDDCHLAEQKWEYKAVALLCTLFIAGKKHVILP